MDGDDVKEGRKVSCIARHGGADDDDNPMIRVEIWGGETSMS